MNENNGSNYWFYNDIYQIPKVVIGLDLSTVSTGISVYSLEYGLLDYGIIAPEKVKGQSAWKYPERGIKFSKSIAVQISQHLDELSHDYEITKIIIEETNPKGKGSMIGTKSLSMCHGIILSEIIDYLPITQFITSSEWRKKLNIKLTSEDKSSNFILRKQKIKEGIVDWKTLAVRYINSVLELDFVYEDNDLADAICLCLTEDKNFVIL